MSTELNLENVVRMGGFKLPTDRYVVRQVASKSGPSQSSGNPMITLSFEIVCDAQGSETVILPNGQTGMVAGIEMDYYLTLTDKTAARIADFHELIGKPLKSIDKENPDLSIYDGLVLDAILRGEEQVSCKDATPEEKAAGKRGVPILDAQGKQVKSYRASIQRILGLSAHVVGRP